MKVFNFTPSDYADEYTKKGFVHIKGGVSPEFLNYALKQMKRLVSDHKEMTEWEFRGKKQQYLFKFGEEWDFPSGVYEAVASVAGLPIEKLTLCERHIKIYEDVAEKIVPPHKDRLASELTVGLPLIVPEDSYLILYPNDELTINPYETTALWRTSLDEEDLPENKLKGIEPIKANVRPGDVILFRGSSIYHERVNPANTSLLYLKFNAMRLDPIGEDPSTTLQFKQSLSFLEVKSDNDLLDSIVEVSPRLIKISRHYTRLHWKEVLQAYVWGEKEFTISETELRIFKKIDGNTTIRDVVRLLGVPEPEVIDFVPLFRRLAKLEGIIIRS